MRAMLLVTCSRRRRGPDAEDEGLQQGSAGQLTVGSRRGSGSTRRGRKTCQLVRQLVAVVRLAAVFISVAVCNAPLSAGCINHPQKLRPPTSAPAYGASDRCSRGCRRLVPHDRVNMPDRSWDHHISEPEHTAGPLDSRACHDDGSEQVGAGGGPCQAPLRRRAGLYARLRGGGQILTSPLWGQHQSVPQSTKARELTVSTFNVLCPLFRRVPHNHSAAPEQTSGGVAGSGAVTSPVGKQRGGKEGTHDKMGRESEYPAMYQPRQQAILELLLHLDSDVICLQEFWVGNDDLVRMFRAQLDPRYQWFSLGRTAGRGDGLVVLVRCVCVCVRARARVRE